MDSGNSGSLQSSSGGDEEYDSRVAASDSVSAFISGASAGPISNPPPPPQFFDPLSNYLQLHQSHNVNSSLIDPSPAWSRITALRSDPNPITHDIISQNTNMLPASSPTFMPSFRPEADGGGPSPTHVLPQQNRNQAAARNPKKRSRASRRAPTTVLTTDTTNFRAMVQEFTGIPSPPFDSSSFPRTGRLDLFGSSRSSTTSYDTTPPPPPYLRRPFPQKVNPPLPFLAPTSTSSAAAIGTSSSSVISSTSNPAINNYQIPITQTSSNPFQNPFLLQTNPKFPFSESAMAAPSKPHRISPFQIPPDDHSHTQFGLSGGHGNNNFIPSSDQISHHNNNTEKDKDHDHDHDGVINMRSLNNDYNFHHGGGKRPENNVAGEGMVESWICSSE